MRHLQSCLRPALLLALAAAVAGWAAPARAGADPETGGVPLPPGAAQRIACCCVPYAVAPSSYFYVPYRHYLGRRIVFRRGGGWNRGWHGRGGWHR